MNTFADNLLARVNSMTGLLGPASLLIDRVVERIAPTSTAQGVCYTGTICHFICSTNACSQLFNEEYVSYAPAGHNCGQPFVCYNGCHCDNGGPF